MNKAIVILFFASLTFVSCGRKSEIEKRLEAHVIEQGNGIIKDYNLKSIDIDTITVGGRIKQLSTELDWADVEPDSSVLRTLRNRDFIEFHYFNPNYEEQVMRGEYKDASEWCTELRVVTEKADSLLAAWPTVKKYNYDYLWLIAWYGDRKEQYYGIDDSWSMHPTVEEQKAALNEMAGLQTAQSDSIVGYDVVHKYSIVNPLLNNATVNISQKVRFDRNLNILSSEN